MNTELLAEIQLLKEENAYLKEQIKLLQKIIFGKKSERIIDSQDDLFLPGLEPSSDDESLEKDKIEVAAHEKRKAKSTPINTIQYPEDLPVETTILDLKDEEKIDSKTGQSLVKIGEEVTKKLAVKPSQFFIKQTVRYKYAVKNNPDEGIKTAELPEAILQRCSCDESFLSNIIVKKFCDHLPLYRQSEMYTREKVYVSRQTLSNYVNKIAETIKPLYELMKKKVLSSGNIFVDETPVKELAPGKGKTDQGYVVAVVGGKSLNPENRFYLYFPNRKHEHFDELLKNYNGVVHSDKYGAYEQLASKKQFTWVPCWVHIRRKFIEAEGANSESKKIILSNIQKLFSLEEKFANLPEDFRLEKRINESVPLIDMLLKIATDEISKVLPKSKMKEALGYLLSLKPYLKNFTKHSMSRLDNNVAERALRPIAVGRKNWLFVGNEASGQNTAILLTFAQTCRALKINPWEYFEDLLRRYHSHPYNQLEDFLPDNWMKSRFSKLI